MARRADYDYVVLCCVVLSFIISPISILSSNFDAFRFEAQRLRITYKQGRAAVTFAKFEGNVAFTNARFPACWSACGCYVISVHFVSSISLIFFNHLLHYLSVQVWQPILFIKKGLP